MDMVQTRNATKQSTGINCCFKEITIIKVVIFMYKIQRDEDIIKIGNKICDDFLAKIDKLHEKHLKQSRY
jgi:hypothetical protein